MLMSDGVHDNLDPELMGLEPSLFNLENWSANNVAQTKTRFMQKFSIEQIIRPILDKPDPYCTLCNPQGLGLTGLSGLPPKEKEEDSKARRRRSTANMYSLFNWKSALGTAGGPTGPTAGPAGGPAGGSSGGPTGGADKRDSVGFSSPLLKPKSPEVGATLTVPGASPSLRASEPSRHDLRKSCVHKSDSKKLHPREVANSFIDHCEKLTTRSRRHLESDEKNLVTNYTEFPGKMDHTTCLTFVVNNVNVS
eukprot:TRINITY_DN8359_c0_g1_i1.p1 TRINITY_DN8359_c0_g1~~TRINITY_DN8359_c0_g1_i1.p1  ORF type:complete len:251 (-),score=43.43 TRINITY_DN8359_c0_g1_i1:198-950(-)